MDLSLESAFSAGGFVGHLSYVLLIVSMCMRRMWLLRVFVVASSLVGIFYVTVFLGDPVGLFWESLLVLVNVAQLTLTYLENRRFAFDGEDARFVVKQLPGLSNRLKRRLLDMGEWRDLAPGAELTRQGEPAERLYFLLSGEVDILVDGVTVARCEEDSFVGEISVLSHGPASADARARTQVRAWSAPAEALRAAAARHPELDQALRASFHRVVLEKLLRSNKLIQTLSSPEDRGGR
ncbi:MAG: cyclic nucleotide-binding domain-containing protein [Pseudomonadota bacterium]